MRRALPRLLPALLPLLAGCLDLSSGGMLKKNPAFIVAGHRGAPLVEAENTLASFTTAVDAQHATGLELDLCVTADGEVVVWHDRDPDDAVALARQAGAEGLLYVPSVPAPGSTLRRPVDALTLAELRAGYGYSKSVGGAPDPEAPIPTLAELAEWLGRAGTVRAVYLDLKLRADQAGLVTALVDAAAAQLPARNGLEFHFLHTNDDVVLQLKSELARVGRDDFHPVRDFEDGDAPSAVVRLGLRDVTLGLTPLRGDSETLAQVDELVRARRKQQLDSVVVWTLDSSQLIGRFLFHGVDGIISNDPQLVHELWQLTL